MQRRVNRNLALAGIVLALSAATVTAQVAIPTRGGGAGRAGGAPGGQGGRGGRGAAAPPVTPAAAPLPTISGEITGPGAFFETFMKTNSGVTLPQFNYETKEYFVAGTANGMPYKTRIVVRKPQDNAKFSGLILAESMHPSGNPWVFHFTHLYSMTSGHIGLEILTSTPAGFADFNQARYGELKIEQGQASEILAQVGALMKSKQPTNPLAALSIRKMVLTGSSASSGVLINYLPTHAALRLADMKPIYDGYLPTSTGATIQPVDVPVIQMPTMTEVQGGNATARQDGDAPGDQYRNYEFAGIAHLDSREADAYYPNPCKYPISRFPYGAYASVALHHLFNWVDKGIVPPRADRILVDRSVANDGSLMALDEFGSPKGGIRNPYVDFPVKGYHVRNEGANPPIANANPFVASRGIDAQNQLCGLAGYELDLTAAQLKKLYKDKKDYQAKVARRLEELTQQGWSLPLYKDYILKDAANASLTPAGTN
jgi:hypothetical protein